MSQVTISRIANPETSPASMLREMEVIADSIRRRAYQLFERRNGNGGSAIEDWLRAERDLVFAPASELVDEGKEFRARVALPGFDAKDIQVTALPEEIVVQAGATHSHQNKDGAVCFCEFSENKLFRRIGLPASVEVDRVAASLDKGILLVTAPKAAPKQLAASA